MRRALCLLSMLLPLGAQTTVAPTNEQVGRARGEDFKNYNIVQSYELGVRFNDIGGNEGKYRSDVNYRNGMRLLASRFSMNSKDGHGKYFDEFTVWTQGLGNDPYQSAGLRAQKNAWWRYDMLWRSNDYYNPALAISSGQHGMNTQRRLQDHDIIIRPQSSLRFFAGFSQAVQDGPALSTVNLFELRDDEFQLVSDVHRRQREYRVGNEFKVLGIRVHWLRTWEQYEESTPLGINVTQTGNNTADRSTLNIHKRTEPYRGNTPGWRVNIMKEGKSFWGVNGRFTNSAGRRQFTLDETGVGTDRNGAGRNRQIMVGGDAQRPVTTGNFTLSLFPSERLTLTNHSAFHRTRMEGNSSYVEYSNSSLSFSRVDFQFLGTRGFTNITDAGFQVAKWFQVHGGYHYAYRDFRSIEQQRFGDFTDRFATTQQNRVHAGMFGFRLQPASGLTVAADGELGRQDRPFFPTSDKDYHALSGRVVYRKQRFTGSATARAAYNFNAVGLSAHSARARTYTADASWQQNAWMSIEGGYSKLHSDTASWLAYFASGSDVTGARSLWLSNIHAVNVSMNFAMGSRISASLGYSRTQDTGGTLPGAPPPTSVFAPAQQFPMVFQSPLARLSVKLNEKIRWNVGYQYYGYNEDLMPTLNYRAHTGYTSLLWTF